MPLVASGTALLRAAVKLIHYGLLPITQLNHLIHNCIYTFYCSIKDKAIPV
jgi:hypothetical protein